MTSRRARIIGWAMMPIFILCAPLAGASAQAPARNLTMAGVVFDSISARPLSGASVEVVDATAPTTSTVFRAQADSAGKFSVGGLNPGKYLVTFSHALLDSLLIETPPKTVDVAPGMRSVSLAVPSLASIGRAICKGVAASDTTGIVLGRVYGAQSLTPAAEVPVVVWWNELVLGATGMRQRQARSVASTSAEGLFGFCAVPTNAEVGLRAEAASDSTAMIALTLASRGVYRRDLFLNSGGSATDVVLRGIARASDGHPVRGASAKITGLGTTATAGDDGHFELHVPAAGTKELEVRAIGFVPEKRIVDLRAGELPKLDVELQTIQQIMDTVKIHANRVYAAGSNGFQARRRSGSGSFFGAEDVDRLQPKDLTDLMRRAPGLFIEDDAMGDAITMRAASLQAPRCVPTVFIDGQRIDDLGARDINAMIKPENLEGMEIYTSGERTPAQFTTLQGCGSIVIWSRIPPSRKKP